MVGVLEMTRVVVVKSDTCPGCKEFLESLQKPEVKEAIKKVTGTDTIDILDFEKDSLAVDIVSSLDDYKVPMLAVLKDEGGKKTVCKLDEYLKPQKCVALKALPP